MRYRCSQCNHTTETRVALSEAQLGVQACVACGAVGTTRALTEASERWWIGIRGERHGPYTVQQLAGLVTEGRISANSYVWGPGFQAWERAGKIPALASAFAARAAPPPPLPPAIPTPPRSPARPVTRAGMFAGPGSSEVSVSHAMPLPVQDSVIAPLVSPAQSQTTPARDAGPVRIDDVRRPPPTVFGMQAVTTTPPAQTPSAVAAPPSVPRAPAIPQSPPRVSHPETPAVPRQVMPLASSPALPVAQAKPVAPVLPPAKPVAPATPVSAVPGPTQQTASQASSAFAVTAASADAPRAATPSAPAISQTAETLLAPVPTSAAAPQGSPAAKDPRPMSTVPATSAVVSAAPSPLPTLSRVPESGGGDAGLDDDFFSGAAPKASNDIFAAMDKSAAEASAGAIDLSAMMADSLSNGRVRQPTKAEMQALRQEFSVVARLEKHKRKRWIYAAAVALFVLGVVVAVVIFAPSRELEYTGRGTSVDNDGEYVAPTYEVPATETPAVAETPETKPEDKPEADKAATRVAASKVGTSGAQRPVTKTSATPTDADDRRVAASKLSAETFAELTKDDVGKSELKLDFDSGAEARKAEAKAAEKKASQAGELAEKVAEVFGKKKSQFARCSDGKQEKLKMIFTVTVSGKVTGAKVDGTQSESKRSCVAEILGRTLFPAGDEPSTYSQTLLL